MLDPYLRSCCHCEAAVGCFSICQGGLFEWGQGHVTGIGKMGFTLLGRGSARIVIGRWALSLQQRVCRVGRDP